MSMLFYNVILRHFYRLYPSRSFDFKINEFVTYVKGILMKHARNIRAYTHSLYTMCPCTHEYIGIQFTHDTLKQRSNCSVHV